MQQRRWQNINLKNPSKETKSIYNFYLHWYHKAISKFISNLNSELTLISRTVFSDKLRLKFLSHDPLTGTCDRVSFHLGSPGDKLNYRKAFEFKLSDFCSCTNLHKIVISYKNYDGFIYLFIFYFLIFADLSLTIFIS